MEWNKLLYIAPVAFALVVFPGCGSNSSSTPSKPMVGDTSGNYVDGEPSEQTPAGQPAER